LKNRELYQKTDICQGNIYLLAKNIFSKKRKKMVDLSAWYGKVVEVMENQIIISSYGNGIAVGIQGNSEHIEKMSNLFFNYGGTTKNGELHMESENFGYFLSTEERLKNALATHWQTNAILNGDSKRFKKNPEGFDKYAKEIAEEIFSQYKRENFMGFNLGETYHVESFAGGMSGFKQKPEEDFHFESVAAKAISQG
jgi:hypothetical protein